MPKKKPSIRKTTTSTSSTKETTKAIRITNPKHVPKVNKIKKSLPKKKPYLGWNLFTHGVTQSILQKFIGCRDRAHKSLALGLKSTDRKEAMEYGTIFHKLIEEGARMGSTYSRTKMVQIMLQYMKLKYPSPESLLLCKIGLAQYHKYKEWEADKPKYKYIAQEPVFKEAITLPATHFNPCPEISINIPRTEIILRGRIDEVIEKNGEIWLQENKTKGRIDLSFLADTIPENIQVMFYAVAAELKYGRPIKGVIYNVIRKPGQRQRKNESDEDFVTRIGKEIEENPSYYFYRLQYAFPPGSIEKWKREELFPILYQIYIWWRSIEKNPTQPWQDEGGNPNPFHGRKSFGIYDALSQGKGDFFDLIVHGRTNGLIVDHEHFPELQDDPDLTEQFDD